jgi:DUF4097 and DUF4098 domain-containing protein YvlB
MSWLISLVIAGALFTNGNVPVGQVYNNQTSQSFTQTDETERIEQTYPFSPNGKVSVSNVNGSITIETWDNPQIKFEAVKIADSRERLADLEIRIDATQNSFDVEADYGNQKNKGGNVWNKNGKLVVNFRLTVPKNAVLDEIQTVNGSVMISNSMNFTKASAVNGSVKAMNLRGNAELSTVNGTVEADFDQLQSGNIISLDTVNGRAILTIPSDANATVRAESLNGSITNDFGLPVRKGKYVGRDLYGKIGSGDVKIKLESVNGGLDVKRKNDGKNQNPVVDLLPQKSSDEDNEDSDFDNDFEAAMRDAQRSLRESQREMERARRETEKNVRTSRADATKIAETNVKIAEEMRIEMEKVKPEIAKISEEALKQAVAAIDLAEINVNVEAATRRAKEIKAMVADERFPWRSPFLEEKGGSYQVKGTPTVKVETYNCSVSVRGWDKPEVKYSMSKVASNVAQQPIEFNAAQKDAGNVEIKVINKNDTGNNGQFNSETLRVRLEVFVPKKSNLKIVTNDEVRLEGISGDVDLQGGDQSINVRDTDGKLKITAEDGIVRVIGFTGELESQLQDGEMFLEGNFQKIRANVQDGTIVLTVPEQTNASVTANTESIEGEGIDLIREETSANQKNRWRIGKGGKDFNFNLADGNVIIRSQNDLNAIL